MRTGLAGAQLSALICVRAELHPSPDGGHQAVVAVEIALPQCRLRRVEPMPVALSLDALAPCTGLAASVQHTQPPRLASPSLRISKLATPRGHVEYLNSLALKRTTASGRQKTTAPEGGGRPK